MRPTVTLAMVLLAALGALAAACAARAAAYDPLAVAAGRRPPALDFTVLDRARERAIPIRVYLPAAGGPAPVVLFSHGLGGSREGYSYLGDHWSRRGLAVVALQHPGSDASVWRDAARGQRMASMRQAASGQNFLLRVKDVPAALDQLEAWNRTPGHPLAGRLDLTRVGMAGHSFGAVTTQAVSGQSFLGRGQPFTLPGIRAAVVMSPSAPRRGRPARAFGTVRIPWLLMTGTRDVSPIGNTDVESRLAVFPALPPGGKYELVLDGAEHAAFAGRSAHHRAILALSTAFWEAYLAEAAAARAWLDGPGPATVLAAADRWQKR